MLKRVVAVLAAVACVAVAQTIVVQAKGYGPDRTRALEDAKRNAVEQAIGSAIQGFTTMENFRVVQDVVKSRAEGYIEKFEMVGDPVPLRDHFEVTIKAWVSTSPMEAEARSLFGSLGGFRIMVFYDLRKPRPESELEHYEYAYARANEFLARNRIRYVDRGTFERLMGEARALFSEQESTVTFAQHLALQANVPVFIDLTRVTVSSRELGIESPYSGQLTAAEATVDASAYNTSSAEGLGSAVYRGEPGVQHTGADAARGALDGAVLGALDKLLYQMSPIVAGWSSTGKPYLVRFFGPSYRTLRVLKDALKSDSRFGGEMEIVSATGYNQWDLTFISSADELADAVLDHADKIPGLAGLDVLSFIRDQVNFWIPGTPGIPDEYKVEPKRLGQ
ncbi:MAG: hypothetical protein R6X12_00780 [bacterium]